MNTKNTDSRNPLVWGLALGLCLIIALAAFIALAGGGGDAATVQSVDQVEVAEDSQADASDDAQQADPAADIDVASDVDEPASDDAAVVEPEPATVVIGQDEEGNDIVMEVDLTGGCAQTFHRPLDADSFSFIRWSYDTPGIEPGTPIRVFADGGFEHFTVVTPDYKVVVEQGITSYGDYRFPSVAWNRGDSNMSVDPLVDHTVDDREGELSETCLPAET